MNSSPKYTSSLLLVSALRTDCGSAAGSGSGGRQRRPEDGGTAAAAGTGVTEEARIPCSCPVPLCDRA